MGENVNIMLREEQETTLRYDAMAEDAILWTSSPVVARKWRKLGYPVTVFGSFKGEEQSWTAIIPKKLIAFRSMKARTKRSLPANHPFKAKLAHPDGKSHPIVQDDSKP